MKFSKYNLFFDYDNQKIGFNSFTREFAVLDPILFLIYESAYMENNLNELMNIHPQFYNFLIEKGFLVDIDVDEVQRVKDLVEKVDNSEDKFEIHINPTMNCNFKCWYCYETHIKDSKMDEKTKDHTLLLVKNILTQKRGKLKWLYISWFGGEPLLYYKKVVVPLLEAVNKLCSENGITFTSGMTTNGLLINQDIAISSKALNLSSFQITLDGNRERHDKVRFISEGRGSYDQIVSNIKLLAKNEQEVIIRINCSKETLPGLKDIVADFSDMTNADRKFISFSIHKVWQEEGNVPDNILTEMRWCYREMGFGVSTASFDTVLDSCYADRRNQVTINYNGELFKCTARDFTTKNSEGLLNDNGEMIWNEKFEKRLSSKFKNKPCLECVIMPICNGGCSQQALEHEGVDYCIYDFDENKKRELVINRFLESLAEAEV